MTTSVLDAIHNCRFCLMCRHVAPVGHLTHNESLTPHGIALVASMQRQGNLSWNASSLEVLYAEPDGGNCRAHCITDQPLPAAIAAVRTEVASEGLAPSHITQIHDRICNQHSAFGSYEPADGKNAWGLFIGDVGFNHCSDTSEAALKLLTSCGIDASAIGKGLDSGFIPCSLGFPDTARKQAELCIEESRHVGVKKLLVLSPQDLFSFTQMYEERLGITWPSDVIVIDLVEFLAEQLREKRLKATLPSSTKDHTTAYIDPTHAVRLPNRFDGARLLSETALGSAPLELFWHKDRAHPVGSTAIQFTRPDLGIQLTEARLDDAMSRGAQTVLCEDPATLHELRLRNHTNLRIQGLYEMLLTQIIGD